MVFLGKRQRLMHWDLSTVCRNTSRLQHHCLSSAATWTRLFRRCFPWLHPP